MARQRKKPTESEKMPATTSPPRAGQKALGVYLDQRLFDALAAYIDRTRPKPSKTAVVEAAIEDYLAARGAWPPPDQPPA